MMCSCESGQRDTEFGVKVLPQANFHGGMSTVDDVNLGQKSETIRVFEVIVSRTGQLGNTPVIRILGKYTGER
jgi:hypothetical protein